MTRACDTDGKGREEEKSKTLLGPAFVDDAAPSPMRRLDRDERWLINLLSTSYQHDCSPRGRPAQATDGLGILALFCAPAWPPRRRGSSARSSCSIGHSACGVLFLVRTGQNHVLYTVLWHMVRQRLSLPSRVMVSWATAQRNARGVRMVSPRFCARSQACHVTSHAGGQAGKRVQYCTGRRETKHPGCQGPYEVGYYGKVSLAGCNSALPSTAHCPARRWQRFTTIASPHQPLRGSMRVSRLMTLPVDRRLLPTCPERDRIACAVKSPRFRGPRFGGGSGGNARRVPRRGRAPFWRDPVRPPRLRGFGSSTFNLGDAQLDSVTSWRDEVEMR